MSVLVYVGANEGFSLWSLFDKFDNVYVFEPDPKTFETLKRRYQQFEWVNLVNAACSTVTGESDFYVTNNKVASSLGCGAKIFQELGEGNVVSNKITVKTVNLSEYLKENNVEEIDLYFSDCQGSDLSALSTLSEYISNKKIKEIFTETHGNGKILYEGLDNQFDGFKSLLSDNYDFIHASLGRLNGHIVKESEIPEDEFEWDSYWRLKDLQPGIGAYLKA